MKKQDFFFPLKRVKKGFCPNEIVIRVCLLFFLENKKEVRRGFGEKKRRNRGILGKENG